MTDLPPTLKPCGIEWIGTMPSHWTCRRLKHVASVELSGVDKKSHDEEEAVRLCNYVDVYYNEKITSALNFMQATATADEIRRFTLRSGDVLITKDSETWDDIAVPAHVPSDLEGVLCAYHLAQVRPLNGLIDGEYLSRSFAARGINDQFRVAATGITRYGISKHWIANALFLVPPLDEQRAISQFLDRETARIDALIDKKRRQIDLLHEKRAASISQAVTKGLDAKTRMTDAGIEWLDGVPAHWEVTRLKFVSVLQTGLTLGKRYADHELVARPYLRVANVQDGYLDLETVTEVKLPLQEAARYELQPGDVLMTEGGDFDKLGRGYVWQGEIPGCLHQNHIFAVRPDARVLMPHFLAAMLTSSHGKNYFTSTSQQTTNLATTNSTKLGSFPVPLPPVAEQSLILERIREDSERLDRLISKVALSIQRLREYRTALMSAAVTGKIDVRNEVA